MKMQPINPDLILARLQAGTLLRHAWGDGRKRACLLAALAPQCAKAEAAHACPASVMPLWLAYLTPLMDDNGSKEAWKPFVLRYAAVAARWHKLDAAAWRRALLGSLAAILEVARERDPSGSCDMVIALCHEGAAADDPRWIAAEKDTKAAEAAARAAGPAGAAIAVRAAAEAARAATEVATATEAAGAAAEAATEAAWAMTEAAGDARWDRVTDGILSAIEAECDRAEAP